MATLTYINEIPLEVYGLGIMAKNDQREVTDDIGRKFLNDKRFEVSGLKEIKKAKKIKKEEAEDAG